MVVSDYNVRNLIHDANFEVKLSNDLYWVPINELGKTRYKNDFFDKNYMKYNLTYVQSEIKNVYEAVQYLNAINFSERKDATIVCQNNIKWEYHVTGIEAIKNKSGCCSSVASALKFLCLNNYDYIGFIIMVRPDTSFHVLMYILENNLYYIFDPSAYVYGGKDDIIFETGNTCDIKGRLFTSMCLRTHKIENYINFYRRILLYNFHEFVFFNVFDKENSVEKIAISLCDSQVFVSFEKNFNLEIIGEIPSKFIITMQ